MSFWQQFLDSIRHTRWDEFVAVFAGILSVWFSRIENIWVYPTGLVSTIIYTYISFEYHLPGEASVNFYYTVMSIYGWALWLKKDDQAQKIVRIEYSDERFIRYQLLFFASCYIILFLALTHLKKLFFEGAIPWADAIASSTAFTGMWLMAKKKVESWYWWLATNIASVPLYYVKGLTLTSVYYFILLIMAVFGLLEWRRRAQHLPAKNY